MKTFLASLMIAAVIVGGSILYSIYLEDMTQDMSDYNQKILNLISEENYDSAKQGVEELTKFIDDRRLALASTMDHNHIDNIERNLAELKAYVSEGQKFDALAKCEILSTLFEHLPKNYSVKLENIL